MSWRLISTTLASCAIRWCESARCLLHKYTASSLEFSLGAPRSSVAFGAGLEPGVPRGALAQALRNGHLAGRHSNNGQHESRGTAYGTRPHLPHPAGLPLLIRDHESQRSFRSGEWLSVT